MKIYENEKVEISSDYNWGHVLYIKNKEDERIESYRLSTVERTTLFQELKNVLKRIYIRYTKDKWFWFFQARSNKLKGLFSSNQNCMTRNQYKVYKFVNRI